MEHIEDDGDDAEEHGHSFKVTGLKAGRNTVLFDNRSDQLHHAVLAPIMGDTTLEEVEEALSSEEPPEGPPPVDFENAAITSVLDGETKQVTELELMGGAAMRSCASSPTATGESRTSPRA